MKILWKTYGIDLLDMNSVSCVTKRILLENLQNQLLKYGLYKNGPTYAINMEYKSKSNVKKVIW